MSLKKVVKAIIVGCKQTGVKALKQDNLSLSKPQKVKVIKIECNKKFEDDNMNRHASEDVFQSYNDELILKGDFATSLSSREDLCCVNTSWITTAYTQLSKIKFCFADFSIKKRISVFKLNNFSLSDVRRIMLNSTLYNQPLGSLHYATKSSKENEDDPMSKKNENTFNNDATSNTKENVFEFTVESNEDIKANYSEVENFIDKNIQEDETVLYIMLIDSKNSDEDNAAIGNENGIDCLDDKTSLVILENNDEIVLVSTTFDSKAKSDKSSSSLIIRDIKELVKDQNENEICERDIGQQRVYSFLDEDKEDDSDIHLNDYLKYKKVIPDASIPEVYYASTSASTESPSYDNKLISIDIASKSKNEKKPSDFSKDFEESVYNKDTEYDQTSNDTLSDPESINARALKNFEKLHSAKKSFPFDDFKNIFGDKSYDEPKPNESLSSSDNQNCYSNLFDYVNGKSFKESEMDKQKEIDSAPKSMNDISEFETSLKKTNQLISEARDILQRDSSSETPSTNFEKSLMKSNELICEAQAMLRNDREQFKATSAFEESLMKSNQLICEAQAILKQDIEEQYDFIEFQDSLSKSNNLINQIKKKLDEDFEKDVSDGVHLKKNIHDAQMKLHESFDNIPDITNDNEREFEKAIQKASFILTELCELTNFLNDKVQNEGARAQEPVHFGLQKSRKYRKDYFKEAEIFVQAAEDFVQKVLTQVQILDNQIENHEFNKNKNASQDIKTTIFYPNTDTSLDKTENAIEKIILSEIPSEPSESKNLYDIQLIEEPQTEASSDAIEHQPDEIVEASAFEEKFEEPNRSEMEEAALLSRKDTLNYALNLVEEIKEYKKQNLQLLEADVESIQKIQDDQETVDAKTEESSETLKTEVLQSTESSEDLKSKEDWHRYTQQLNEEKKLKDLYKTGWFSLDQNNSYEAVCDRYIEQLTPDKAKAIKKWVENTKMEDERKKKAQAELEDAIKELIKKETQQPILKHSTLTKKIVQDSQDSVLRGVEIKKESSLTASLSKCQQNDGMVDNEPQLYKTQEFSNQPRVLSPSMKIQEDNKYQEPCPTSSRVKSSPELQTILKKYAEESQNLSKTYEKNLKNRPEYYQHVFSEKDLEAVTAMKEEMTLIEADSQLSPKEVLKKYVRVVEPVPAKASERFYIRQVHRTESIAENFKNKDEHKNKTKEVFVVAAQRPSDKGQQQVALRSTKIGYAHHLKDDTPPNIKDQSTTLSKSAIDEESEKVTLTVTSELQILPILGKIVTSTVSKSGENKPRIIAVDKESSDVPKSKVFYVARREPIEIESEKKPEANFKSASGNDVPLTSTPSDKLPFDKTRKNQISTEKVEILMEEQNNCQYKGIEKSSVSTPKESSYPPSLGKVEDKGNTYQIKSIEQSESQISATDHKKLKALIAQMTDTVMKQPTDGKGYMGRKWLQNEKLVEDAVKTNDIVCLRQPSSNQVFRETIVLREFDEVSQDRHSSNDKSMKEEGQENKAAGMASTGDGITKAYESFSQSQQPCNTDHSESSRQDLNPFRIQSDTYRRGKVELLSDSNDLEITRKNNSDQSTELSHTDDGVKPTEDKKALVGQSDSSCMGKVEVLVESNDQKVTRLSKSVIENINELKDGLQPIQSILNNVKKHSDHSTELLNKIKVLKIKWAKSQSENEGRPPKGGPQTIKYESNDQAPSSVEDPEKTEFQKNIPDVSRKICGVKIKDTSNKIMAEKKENKIIVQKVDDATKITPKALKKELDNISNDNTLKASHISTTSSLKPAFPLPEQEMEAKKFLTSTKPNVPLEVTPTQQDASKDLIEKAEASSESSDSNLKKPFVSSIEIKDQFNHANMKVVNLKAETIASVISKISLKEVIEEQKKSVEQNARKGLDNWSSEIQKRQQRERQYKTSDNVKAQESKLVPRKVQTTDLTSDQKAAIKPTEIKQASEEKICTVAPDTDSHKTALVKFSTDMKKKNAAKVQVDDVSIAKPKKIDQEKLKAHAIVPAKVDNFQPKILTDIPKSAIALEVNVPKTEKLNIQGDKTTTTATSIVKPTSVSEIAKQPNKIYKSSDRSEQTADIKKSKAPESKTIKQGEIDMVSKPSNLMNKKDQKEASRQVLTPTLTKEQISENKQSKAENRLEKQTQSILNTSASENKSNISDKKEAIPKHSDQIVGAKQKTSTISKITRSTVSEVPNLTVTPNQKDAIMEKKVSSDIKPSQIVATEVETQQEKQKQSILNTSASEYKSNISDKKEAIPKHSDQILGAKQKTSTISKLTRSTVPEVPNLTVAPTQKDVISEKKVASNIKPSQIVKTEVETGQEKQKQSIINTSASEKKSNISDKKEAIPKHSDQIAGAKQSTSTISKITRSTISDVPNLTAAPNQNDAISEKRAASDIKPSQIVATEVETQQEKQKQSIINTSASENNEGISTQNETIPKHSDQIVGAKQKTSTLSKITRSTVSEVPNLTAAPNQKDTISEKKVASDIKPSQIVATEVETQQEKQKQSIINTSTSENKASISAQNEAISKHSDQIIGAKQKTSTISKISRSTVSEVPNLTAAPNQKDTISEKKVASDIKPSQIVATEVETPQEQQSIFNTSASGTKSNMSDKKEAIPKPNYQIVGAKQKTSTLSKITRSNVSEVLNLTAAPIQKDAISEKRAVSDIKPSQSGEPELETRQEKQKPSIFNTSASENKSNKSDKKEASPKHSDQIVGAKQKTSTLSKITLSTISEVLNLTAAPAQKDAISEKKAISDIKSEVETRQDKQKQGTTITSTSENKSGISDKKEAIQKQSDHIVGAKEDTSTISKNTRSTISEDPNLTAAPEQKDAISEKRTVSDIKPSQIVATEVETPQEIQKPSMLNTLASENKSNISDNKEVIPKQDTSSISKITRSTVSEILNLTAAPNQQDAIMEEKEASDIKPSQIIATEVETPQEIQKPSMLNTLASENKSDISDNKEVIPKQDTSTISKITRSTVSEILNLTAAPNQQDAIMEEKEASDIKPSQIVATAVEVLKPSADQRALRRTPVDVKKENAEQTDDQRNSKLKTESAQIPDVSKSTKAAASEHDKSIIKRQEVQLKEESKAKEAVKMMPLLKDSEVLRATADTETKSETKIDSVIETEDTQKKIKPLMEEIFKRTGQWEGLTDDSDRKSRIIEKKISATTDDKTAKASELETNLATTKTVAAGNQSKETKETNETLSKSIKDALKTKREKVPIKSNLLFTNMFFDKRPKKDAANVAKEVSATRYNKKEPLFSKLRPALSKFEGLNKYVRKPEYKPDSGDKVAQSALARLSQSQNDLRPTDKQNIKSSHSNFDKGVEQSWYQKIKGLGQKIETRRAEFKQEIFPSGDKNSVSIEALNKVNLKTLTEKTDSTKVTEKEPVPKEPMDTKMNKQVIPSINQKYRKPTSSESLIDKYEKAIGPRQRKEKSDLVVLAESQSAKVSRNQIVKTETSPKDNLLKHAAFGKEKEKYSKAMKQEESKGTEVKDRSKNEGLMDKVDHIRHSQAVASNTTVSTTSKLMKMPSVREDSKKSEEKGRKVTKSMVTKSETSPSSSNQFVKREDRIDEYNNQLGHSLFKIEPLHRPSDLKNEKTEAGAVGKEEGVIAQKSDSLMKPSGFSSTEIDSTNDAKKASLKNDTVVKATAYTPRKKAIHSTLDLKETLDKSKNTSTETQKLPTKAKGASAASSSTDEINDIIEKMSESECSFMKMDDGEQNSQKEEAAQTVDATKNIEEKKSNENMKQHAKSYIVLKQLLDQQISHGPKMPGHYEYNNKPAAPKTNIFDAKRDKKNRTSDTADSQKIMNRAVMKLRPKDAGMGVGIWKSLRSSGSDHPDHFLANVASNKLTDDSACVRYKRKFVNVPPPKAIRLNHSIKSSPQYSYPKFVASVSSTGSVAEASSSSNKIKQQNNLIEKLTRHLRPEKKKLDLSELLNHTPSAPHKTSMKRVAPRQVVATTPAKTRDDIQAKINHNRNVVSNFAGRHTFKPEKKKVNLALLLKQSIATRSFEEDEEKQENKESPYASSLKIKKKK